jgi:hypothetical protein
MRERHERRSMLAAAEIRPISNVKPPIYRDEDANSKEERTWVAKEGRYVHGGIWKPCTREWSL